MSEIFFFAWIMGSWLLYLSVVLKIMVYCSNSFKINLLLCVNLRFIYCPICIKISRVSRYIVLGCGPDDQFWLLFWSSLSSVVWAGKTGILCRVILCVTCVKLLFCRQMLNYVQANIHSVVSGHQVASSFKSNHSTVSLLNQFVWIQMTSLKQSDTV